MKQTLIALALVAALGAGGVFLHAAVAGPTQAPELAAEGVVASQPAAAPAEGAARPEPEVTEGGSEGIPADMQVPEPDPRYPFARDIPGCVCHSDDPKMVEQHADFRMNQCAGCHGGETPTGRE